MTQKLELSQFPLIGTQFIEASAGTGKTYTLISLILKMIIERGIPIESIVVVTFTVAATEEIKERVLLALEELTRVLHLSESVLERETELKKYKHIDEALVDVRAVQALRNIDRAAIFTIHGFAARILQEFSLEAGIESDQPLIDRPSLTQEIAQDYFSGSIATLPRKYLKVLGGSQLLNELGIILRELEGLNAPELVPPQPGVEGLQVDALLSKFESLKQRCRDCHHQLKTHGAELVKSLAASKDLKGQSYSPKSLNKEYQDLLLNLGNDELNVSSLHLNLFTSAKFLQSRTKGGVSKNAQPPDCFEFFDQLQVSLESITLEVEREKSRLFYEAVRHIFSQRFEHEELLGVQSFDTLLSDLLESLKKRGEPLKRAVRGRYNVALIDEFQDTDEVQYEIFRRLFVDDKIEPGVAPSLILIGDPKQAIYSFRGADIHTYLRAARDADKGRFSLATNYRSSPSVIEALNALFGIPKHPFRIAELRYEPVQPRKGACSRLLDSAGFPVAGLEMLRLEGLTGRNRLSANALPCLVKDLAWRLTSGFRLQGQPLSPRDFAMLLPTNAKVQAAAKALRALQIPCVLHSTASVYHSPEALDLLEVLEALLQPTGLSQLKRALLTPLFDVDTAKIAEFDRQGLEVNEFNDAASNKENARELETLNSYLEQFIHWSRLWADFGLARVLSELINNAAKTLVLREGGERSLTNYRHLMELLEEQARKERLGRTEVLRFLQASTFEKQSFGDDSTQLRLDTDEDAVTLMTYHKSKGLEFEVVYAVELAAPKSTEKNKGIVVERLETKDTRGASETLERVHFRRPLSEELLEAKEERLRQERLRIAYVALTRAKEQVISCYVPEEKNHGVFSDWLSESDEQSLDWQVLKDALGEERSGVFKLRSSDELLDDTELKQRVLRHKLRGEQTQIYEPVSHNLRRPAMKTSSFSQMTKRSHHQFIHTTAIGRELDEPLQAEAKSEVIQGKGRVCLLKEFERGAKAGDALHQVLEDIPFSVDEKPSREKITHEVLSERGYNDEMISCAQQGLEMVISAPLDVTTGLSLSSLKKQAQIAEMEFQFPVGQQQDAQATLTPESLAQAMQGGILFEDELLQSGDADVLLKLRNYAQSLQQLDFDSFHGFLRGFIDLVYEADGRYYVLDYKSNDMGGYYDDYHSARLAGSMLEHHYLLQAAIYTLALHRFLGLRLKDYDYEQNIGGSRYAYLRGMHPDEPGRGVFSFSFTKACIERLDQLMSKVPQGSWDLKTPQWLQQTQAYRAGNGENS